MDNNFSISFKTTDDIKIPQKIVDQVIGQEAAVEIIKKAAIQRRNVLLVGAPGTGKSMLGQALSQLLPAEKLVDILAFPKYPALSHSYKFRNHNLLS